MEPSALLQALSVFVLTFVLEDAAIVGAAVITMMGPLSPAAGKISALAGIWLGDLALYLLARRYGRALLSNPWFRRLAGTPDLEQSERWFTRYGTWVIFFSRFLPGARLPVYTTAGVLRVSPLRFALVTAVACLIWVEVIFRFSHLLTAMWLEHFKSATAALIVLVVAALLGTTLLKRLLLGRRRTPEQRT